MPWPAVVSSTDVSMAGVTALRNLPPGYRGRAVSPTDEQCVEPTTWCQCSRPRILRCLPIPLSTIRTPVSLVPLPVPFTTAPQLRSLPLHLYLAATSFLHLLFLHLLPRWHVHHYQCLLLAQGVCHSHVRCSIPGIRENSDVFFFADPCAKLRCMDPA